MSSAKSKIKEVVKRPRDPWAKFNLPSRWNNSENSDLLTDSEVVPRYDDEKEDDSFISKPSKSSDLDSVPDEGPIDGYLYLNKWAVNSLNLLPAKLRMDTKLIVDKNKSMNGCEEEEEAAEAYIPPSNKDSHTLYHLLNYCRSPGGRAMLQEWIRKPLTDFDTINKRHDMVQFFVDSVGARQQLSDSHLRTIPDLGRMVKKFEKDLITLRDLYACYTFVNRLSQIVPILADAVRERNGLDDQLNLSSDQIEDLDEVSQSVVKILIAPLKNLDNEFADYIKQMDSVIDKEKIKRNEISVNPLYDEELTELDERLKELEQKAESIREKAQKDLGVMPRLEVSDTGYLMRVSLKEEICLRGKQKTYKPRMQTKKDGVRFVTDALIDINDDYVVAKKEYKAKAKAVEDEIIESFLPFKDPIEKLRDVASLLDVIVSLSVAAVTASVQYVRPKMLPKGGGEMILEKVRHPCLEKISESFIPNDVEMKDEGQKFLIVQGPNMGGKSTYIRSIGMAVVMAQMGSFVACDEATIPVMDAIFTRIGAGDRMLEGISTFMEEMLDCSLILEKATPDSLVLIDELGRGTSTHDGYGIAYAIAEKLIEMKSYVLFTTHFHELSCLADKYNQVGNLHVKVVKGINDKDVVITYEMIPGKSTGSYGIQIAESLKFPPHVIAFARRFEWIEEPCLTKEEADQFLEMAQKEDKEGLKNFIENMKDKIAAPEAEF